MQELGCQPNWSDKALLSTVLGYYDTIDSFLKDVQYEWFLRGDSWDLYIKVSFTRQFGDEIDNTLNSCTFPQPAPLIVSVEALAASSQQEAARQKSENAELLALLQAQELRINALCEDISNLERLLRLYRAG